MTSGTGTPTPPAGRERLCSCCASGDHIYLPPEVGCICWACHCEFGRRVWVGAAEQETHGAMIDTSTTGQETN